MPLCVELFSVHIFSATSTSQLDTSLLVAMCIQPLLVLVFSMPSSGQFVEDVKSACRPSVRWGMIKAQGDREHAIVC